MLPFLFGFGLYYRRLITEKITLICFDNDLNVYLNKIKINLIKFLMELILLKNDKKNYEKQQLNMTYLSFPLY